MITCIIYLKNWKLNKYMYSEFTSDEDAVNRWTFKFLFKIWILENESTLTISNVQKDRAGQYVCRLRYSVLGVNGTKKAAADVFVYSPGTEKIRTQNVFDLKKK